MSRCDCQQLHSHRRVVLTGGPGAGKTAVLELVRQSFCRHVTVLPEAASMLFAGGFRRGNNTAGKQAAQRAIFHVQRGLEEMAENDGNPAVVLCDRGTVDGYAYWPEGSDFWAAVGTTRESELARYDAVIHLRTPAANGGYDNRNPLRIENAAEAAAIDAKIAEAWKGHRRYYTVDNTADFLTKANNAIDVLRDLVPECCRHHIPDPRVHGAVEAHR